MQAAAWATWIEDLDDDSPVRQLRLEFDTRSRLLETVMVVFDRGNELVVEERLEGSVVLDAELVVFVDAGLGEEGQVADPSIRVVASCIHFGAVHEMVSMALGLKLINVALSVTSTFLATRRS